MLHYVIVPGLGNSGSRHWQSLWEKELPGVIRVCQKDWQSPICTDWVERLNQSLNGLDCSQTVLIGHSLGCIAIVHWAARYGQSVKGAFLVAPADIERPAYEFLGKGFVPVPMEPLRFPSIIVASTNDPWLSAGQANVYAHAWGSELHWLGEAGHINADSGFGAWPEGLELLAKSF